MVEELLSPQRSAKLLVIAARKLSTLGGVGSGNFGHGGRPGEKGGSSSVDSTEGAIARELGLPTTYHGKDSETKFGATAVDNPLPQSTILTHEQTKRLPIMVMGESKTVDISTLKSTQDYVQPSAVKNYKDGLYMKSQPIVATVHGHEILLNGNHNVVAAKLKGEKTISVQHLGDFSKHADYIKSVDKKFVGLAASGRRKETLLHLVADAHVSKVTVAVRYAFARGRQALGHPPNAQKASDAVHDALMEVLPNTLLKVLKNGGDAGLVLLKSKLRTAGDKKGHEFHGNQYTDAALQAHYEKGFAHGQTGYGFQKHVAGRKGTPLHKAYRHGYDKGVDASGVRSLGGVGSGNFGHGGRPGEKGGSGDTFHGTSIKSAQRIKTEGLKPGVDNVVYVAEAEQDAVAYGLYHTVRDQFAIVVVKSSADVKGRGEGYATSSKVIEPRHVREVRIYSKKQFEGLVYDTGEMIEGASLPKPLKVLEEGDLYFIVELKELRTLKSKHPLQMKFDVSNPEAIKWAKKHAGESAKSISATTRDAIRAAVARATEEGDLETLYDDILSAVGDVNRADSIARTEVMFAANEGQRQSWNQAVDEGLLTGDEKPEWIATENTPCPLCENLDGQLRELDGEYPDDGGEGPPLHPHCRCTEGLSAIRVAGGAGSGNFGHSGRPGEKGGSGEDGAARPTSTELTSAIAAIQKDRDNFAEEESESEKLWRRDGALEAIEKVLTNQQRADQDPELAKDSFFAYKLDKSVVGGVSAAVHAKLEGNTVELKWAGSLRKGQGRALIEDSIRWAKSKGASELIGTSKYGSIGYYERTYGAVKTSKEDPFTTNFQFKIDFSAMKHLTVSENV